MTAWTHHGGRLNAARATFGDGPWIDLSTGINPNPWPGISGAEIDWAALPDEDALAALERTAAAHFGVDPAYLCAVPGTEIGLRLVAGLIDGPAVRVAPAYRTHGEMLPASREITPQALTHVAGTSILLANPNNPDGRVTTPALLDTLLARLTGSPHWLMVDEAFADTDPAIGMAARIREDARLILFRSFGKFFGLAGVRLGFVLGSPAVIAWVRERLGSWPVSAAALAIGTAAYADWAWITATRTRLHDQAAALDAVLRRHGLEPQGECPLFRLVAVDNAAGLFTRLAHRHILTRPFDAHPDWLRIGLPANPDALARLDAALAGG